MEKVVLDSPVSARLESCPDEAELCDAAGRTVGFFVPAWLRRKLWYAWAHQAFADTSPEELERIRNEPGGMTTAEAIDYINRLAKEPPQDAA